MISFKRLLIAGLILGCATFSMNANRKKRTNAQQEATLKLIANNAAKLAAIKAAAVAKATEKAISITENEQAQLVQAQLAQALLAITDIEVGAAQEKERIASFIQKEFLKRQENALNNAIQPVAQPVEIRISTCDIFNRILNPIKSYIPKENLRKFHNYCIANDGATYNELNDFLHNYKAAMLKANEQAAGVIRTAKIAEQDAKIAEQELKEAQELAEKVKAFQEMLAAENARKAMTDNENTDNDRENQIDQFEKELQKLMKRQSSTILSALKTAGIAISSSSVLAAFVNYIFNENILLGLPGIIAGTVCGTTITTIAYAYDRFKTSRAK